MARAYNKKRNTYFLFESLVNGFAAKQFDSPGACESEFVELCGAFFKEDTALGKDRKLYEEILAVRGLGLSRENLEYVLRESKRRRDNIDANVLFDEQSCALNKIVENFGDGALGYEVDNYRLIANIKQYFEAEHFGEMLKFEGLICEELEQQEVLHEEPESEAVPEVETDEQKTLVGLYESSNPGFSLFLNDEIRRIKPILKEASICPACDACDLEMKGKTVQILHMLEEFKKRPASKDDVRFMVKVQALAKELEEQ